MRQPDMDLNIGSSSARCNKEKVSNESFVALVTENYAMYINKSYAYLKCPKLAEDAVQEGVMAAHLSLASVKDSAALGAWLYRIIIRKAIDSLRNKQKLPRFDDDLDELVTYSKDGLLNAPIWATVSNPEEEILKSEGLEQVRNALEALNDVHRIPIMLKDFEGFSIKEISALLGISESNVKVRIHRGRLKLRNELKGYFFPSETSDSK